MKGNDALVSIRNSFVGATEIDALNAVTSAGPHGCMEGKKGAAFLGTFIRNSHGGR